MSCVLVSAPTVSRGEVAAPATTAQTAEAALFDRIWALPRIYQNEESDFLNELRFTGRFHLDAYALDSNLGSDSDWVVRRLRAGMRARFFHRLEARVEVAFNAQAPTPFYQRLTDAYLSWKFNDAATLAVGKQAAEFTLDGATSSNDLLTIDRSHLANNLWFTERFIPGVTLFGNPGAWFYNVGLFSGGSANPEFGNFNAGNFLLASVGYDFAAPLGVKKALLRADYVYNQPNANSTFTRTLEEVGALVFIFDDERWGCSAEVAAARGSLGQSDLFGANVMPWVRITKRLQAVARYTYVASDGPNGVRFSRYENAQTSARGDRYQELYAGLNYYLHGHRLKLQTGVAYVTMDGLSGTPGDYEGWSWTTGLRASW